MKRFKDLDAAQKAKAIDHLYQRGMKGVRWNGVGQPDNIKKRLKEITERIKFCGCTDCDIKLYGEIQKDSLIKEVILDKARVIADSAYYPEEEDTLITVK